MKAEADVAEASDEELLRRILDLKAKRKEYLAGVEWCTDIIHMLRKETQKRHHLRHHVVRDVK